MIATNCGMLLEGITRTVFATANDDLRPVMNCILMEMGPENFTFVASDAHKLVRYKRFDAKTDGDQFALILPKKPSLLLKNILPKDDSELRLQFNEKMACFTFGNYKMVCTLVEGRFPNYNSVIPQNNPKKIIIEKKELYNSLRRVSVMANQASNLVKFDLSNGTIVISAQDVDYANVRTRNDYLPVRGRRDGHRSSLLSCKRYYPTLTRNLWYWSCPIRAVRDCSCLSRAIT